MLHKAWNSKGEIPYCFPRSSIKLQGHTVQNITDFDPNWGFTDYRPVAAFKSLRFALLLSMSWKTTCLKRPPSLMAILYMFHRTVVLTPPCLLSSSFSTSGCVAANPADDHHGRGHPSRHRALQDTDPCQGHQHAAALGTLRTIHRQNFRRNVTFQWRHHPEWGSERCDEVFLHFTQWFVFDTELLFTHVTNLWISMIAICD